MNSVGTHSGNPIPQQHSSNSANTPPTHTPETSSSQDHTENPQRTSTPAIDAL